MINTRKQEPPLSLEPYVPEVVTPCFKGSVGRLPVIIRLDEDATFKLAEDAEGDALVYLLNCKRARVRDAAQELLNRGLYHRRSDRLEILVTADDLSEPEIQGHNI